MKIQFSGADNEYLNCNILTISEEDCKTNNLIDLNSTLAYIFRTEPRAHKSFFRTDGGLTHGTICLVDETDAEIREDQHVHGKSEIVLISTLHGG